MKRLISSLIAPLLVAMVFAAPSAADEGFGLKDLDVTFTNQDTSPAVQAGSHPFAFTTVINAKTTIDPEHGEIPIDAIKDLKIELPEGLVGNPTAVSRCSSVVFLESTEVSKPKCPNEAVVGLTTTAIGIAGPEFFTQPVYNLIPPPGSLLKLGFIANGIPVTLEIGLKDTYPYNPAVTVANIPQPVGFYGSVTTVWGNPASPSHNTERGTCLQSPGQDSCPVSGPERPFLTLPRSCEGPLSTIFEVDSWQHPDAWLPPYTVLTHDNGDPPSSLGLSGCSILGFAPRIDSQPTTDQAESPSGLDFKLDINDENLTSPDGNAQSDIKKAVVTLPEGVTANPSVAEGLSTCSEVDLDREALASKPGEGCPQASKVGTVEVETPLLEGEILKGQLFIATQNENPFHTLLALYMVIRSPELGILVKLPGKVEPDPKTGRLVTTFGEAPYEIPQFPFSHFRFHFREGGRSPLITPPRCGTYTTRAVFTPWANPANPLATTSSFEVTKGVGGAPCPSGPQPFDPGFSAGTVNNDAKSYSPFYMRLTRRDGDQDLTRFSFTLPPGLLGKLAGISQCSDAAIAVSRAKTGRGELAAPSCPQSSEIGGVIGGAGVGSQLTYVPGKLYLAGPFAGDPLSVVAIVPAVAGPFDVGTIVVRVALTLNPSTAQVEVDSARSEPIPHILAGIPLRVRDVRVSADRDRFTLNPTNCDPFAVQAQLWGGGSDAFSALDDSPVGRSDHFQASNCAALGFKPKLALSLKGGTRRGAHPALKAVVTPRAADANFAKVIVTLPRSAFLDQGHIRTICTRVQYAAKACPAGAVYGHAKAWTPLLDEPAEGPVYLRSSNHKLPDLVMALKGPPSAAVNVDVVGRIDSNKGGIRGSFETIPDVPVSKFVLNMQGGKKGLIVNSRNLCEHQSRAIARLEGQNGDRRNFRSPVRPAGCRG